MAAKRKSSRKARKPDVYTVEGQKLSADQWHVYCQKRRQRMTNAIHRAQRDVDNLALQDTMYDELATTRAADRFGPLFRRATDAGLVIGSLKEFKFYGDDQKLIGLGNAVIRHCAEELLAVVSELNSIHDGIAKQIASEAVHV